MQNAITTASLAYPRLRNFDFSYAPPPPPPFPPLPKPINAQCDAASVLPGLLTASNRYLPGIRTTLHDRSSRLALLRTVAIKGKAKAYSGVWRNLFGPGNSLVQYDVDRKVNNFNQMKQGQNPYNPPEVTMEAEACEAVSDMLRSPNCYYERVADAAC